MGTGPERGRRRSTHRPLPRLRARRRLPSASSLEYAYSFLATARLALRERRAGAFDVVQACNPPDIFWPLARWLRRRDGTRFVFDHHDLCPELYVSRFADGPRAAAPCAAPAGAGDVPQQRTGSPRPTSRMPLSRPAVGASSRSHVTVVRTGPDPNRLRRREALPELRRGREHLVAYLGVMGPQDGVDLALARSRRHRQLAWAGATSPSPSWEPATAHADLVSPSATGSDSQDFVELPGRVPDETVAEVLSTADVGLCPDPLNPLNDVSTMNKTMEYMAFGLPVVAFDLTETRVSAADAARYVEPNDVDGLCARCRGSRRRATATHGHGAAGPRARREAPGLAAPAGRLPRALRRTGGASRPRLGRDLSIHTSTSTPDTSGSGTPKRSETSTARETVGHLSATEA